MLYKSSYRIIWGQFMFYMALKTHMEIKRNFTIYTFSLNLFSCRLGNTSWRSMTYDLLTRQWEPPFYRWANIYSSQTSYVSENILLPIFLNGCICCCEFLGLPVYHHLLCSVKSNIAVSTNQKKKLPVGIQAKIFKRWVLIFLEHSEIKNKYILDAQLSIYSDSFLNFSHVRERILVCAGRKTLQKISMYHTLYSLCHFCRWRMV